MDLWLGYLSTFLNVDDDFEFRTKIPETISRFFSQVWAAKPKPGIMKCSTTLVSLLNIL